MQALQKTWPHLVTKASLIKLRQIVHQNYFQSLSTLILRELGISLCICCSTSGSILIKDNKEKFILFMQMQICKCKIQIQSGQQYIQLRNTMFDMLMGPKVPLTSINFINLIDTTIKNNQSFLRTMEKWRNLQVSYIGKLAELHSQANQRQKRGENEGDNILMKILQLLQNSHKNLVNKYNHDVFMTSFAASQILIFEQKGILENQKVLHKELCSKKEILEKVRTRKVKLKKSMEQQLTLHVFSHDSVETTMDKKVKRFNKMKQIEKQQQQYELKVKQTKQIFDTILEKVKSNLKRFNEMQNSIINNRIEMVTKFQMHILNFAKNLIISVQTLHQKSTQIQQEKKNSVCISNEFLDDEESKIINTIKIEEGYLETTLKIINDKNLDQYIEYSKDREVKKRIKQIIQSNEVSAEETDEFTRQVQIMKKILKEKDSGSIIQYKNFITKGCKFRLNFVFILQLYRLNNQFQLSLQELKPIIILINSMLETCHENKDAFVLKQLMVLMLTYYVMYNEEGREEKIYIYNFFKNNAFWREMQLWESILIQCIYLEKKATIKMILTTSAVSNKSELIEAQKTSVLNQILYVVRNMVLFDFNQKQVKDFSNKFVKLLKQDDKFLKDVYRSIDNAIKEQQEHKPPEIAAKFINDVKKIMLDGL